MSSIPSHGGPAEVPSMTRAVRTSTGRQTTSIRVRTSTSTGKGAAPTTRTSSVVCNEILCSIETESVIPQATTFRSPSPVPTITSVTSSASVTFEVPSDPTGITVQAAGSSDNGGVSAGVIAAAVVVPVVVLAAAGILAWLWLRRRKQQKYAATSQQDGDVPGMQMTRTSTDPLTGYTVSTEPAVKSPVSTVSNVSPTRAIARKQISPKQDPTSQSTAPQIPATVFQPVSPIDDRIRIDPFDDPTPGGSTFLPASSGPLSNDDGPRFFSGFDSGNTSRQDELFINEVASQPRWQSSSSTLGSRKAPKAPRPTDGDISDQEDGTRHFDDDEISLPDEEVEFGQAAPAQRQRASVISMQIPSSPILDGPESSSPASNEQRK